MFRYVVLSLTLFAAAITAAATSRLGEIIALAAAAFTAALEFYLKNWLFGEEYPWYYPRCLFSTPPAPLTLKWFFNAVTGEDLYRCSLAPTWTAVFVNMALLVGVTCLIAYTLWKVMVQRTSIVGNFYTTWILEKFTNDSIQPPDPAPRRVTFDHSVDVYKYVPTTHTHGSSAAVRNNGSTFLCFVAKQMGLNPYIIQMSRSDQRRGREGCRSVHWAKDMYSTSVEFKPQAGSAYVYIDVDMYMDMPRILCCHATVHLISTFQPTSVAESAQDFSFTFDSDSVVHYNVAGGASFSHKVWNYAGDVIYPAVFDWTCFQFRSVAYHVQRRQADAHHQLICLIPFRVFKSVMPIHRLLPAQPLERLVVAVDDDFLRLEVVTENGTNVSTGLTNRWVSATIPAALDDTLAVASSLARDDLSMATTLQTAKTATGTPLPTEAAHVLLAYHRAHEGKVSKTSKTYPVQPPVTKFQYLPEIADTEAECCMKSFMKPLCKPAAAPVKSRANEQRSIDGRVNEIRTPLLKPSATQLQRIEFFTEHIVPAELAGTGVPVDEAEVFKRQNRPSQVQILNRAVESPEEVSEETLETMMKAEAYGKVTDPRNITMIPGKNKLVYSRYMYDFVDKIMAFKPWYAFCRTPKEIALKVAEICKQARSHVNCGDLARFDGRMSNICRLVERYVMTRYFGPDPTLMEVMDTQLEQKARTRNGVKYSTGQSRLSGSPETAAFNTLVNAFMVFSAFCEMGYTMEEAMELLDTLAILGGDDSLVADVDCAAYVKACKDVGHLLEPEEITQGEFGVNFLARFYSDQVWYGSPDSMCDLTRQLSKLHMTVSMPASVTPAQKLKEKATSYVLTDANTPVIGPYCEQALQTLQHVDTPDTIFAPIRSWFARFDRTVQWPNSNSTRWMEWYLVNKWLPTFDHRTFNLWLHGIAEGRESLFDCPGFERVDLTVPAVKQEVIVNDTIVSPPQPAESEKPGKPAAPRATTPKGTPRPAGRGNNARTRRNTPQTPPSAGRTQKSEKPHGQDTIAATSGEAKNPGPHSIVLALVALSETFKFVFCCQIIWHLSNFVRGIWGFCRERAIGGADPGPELTPLCYCSKCTQARRQHPNSLWTEPIRSEIEMSRFFRESVRGSPEYNRFCSFRFVNHRCIPQNPFAFDPPHEKMSSQPRSQKRPFIGPLSERASKRAAKRQRTGGSSVPKASRPNPKMQPDFPTGSSYRQDKPMVIVEDEFIQNIKGSIDFRNHAVLSVNPGQSGTFPWLSAIAKQFEKYEFQSLEFYYKPTVSAFSTAGQTGKLMLSMDFDASDPPPSNKQQVEDRYPHADCMPYERTVLRIPARHLKNQDAKFVRPGALPANSDIKTYDIGTLSVSTEGNGALDSEIGELRVRYAVHLKVPVLEDEVAPPTNFHTSQFWCDTQIGDPNTSPEIAVPWNATDPPSVLTYPNPLQIGVSDNALTFPPGHYIVSVSFDVVATSGTAQINGTAANFNAVSGPTSQLEIGEVRNNAALIASSFSRTFYLEVQKETTYSFNLSAEASPGADPVRVRALLNITAV